MNDIKSQIDELFDEIKESELYKTYQDVTTQLENNKDIMKLIAEIKRLQKIATNNKDSVIENNIKELYSKLNEYPVYASYLDTKERLNEELSYIKDVFEKYFEKLLKL